MLSRFLHIPLACVLILGCAPSIGRTAETNNADRQATLISVLKSSGDQKAKADACRELGRVGTKSAVPALAALLEDEKLSHMARYALESIPGAEADKALRDALSKLHGKPLVGVIGSLGVRHDTAAVKPLSALLANADPEVAQAAARALGTIGTKAGGNAILAALPKTSPVNQLAFAEGLFRCAERCAAVGDRKFAITIYDRLRALPAAAHQVRAGALRGAILTRGQKGLGVLLEALKAPEFQQFDAAIKAFLELPGSEVTSAVASQISKLPADRQIVLIQALGKRGDVLAIQELAAAARNCEPGVRVAAIRSLAEFGNPGLAPLFLELMRSPDKEIARAARESLAGLPGREVDQAVLNMLGSSDKAVCLTGMDLAVRRRMGGALPVLLKTAEGTDLQMRVAALNRVGELSGPGGAPQVLALLARAKTTEDLEAAEQALGNICSRAANRDECLGLIEPATAKAEPAQRAALLRLAGSLGGPRALKLVQAGLQDSNADVHAAALRTLSTWNSPDAAPALLELARNSDKPTDQMLALRGYLRLAGHSDLPEAERLVMCRNAQTLVAKPEEKRLLLAALGQLNSVEAFSLIEPYLAEDATKGEAASGILAISDRMLNGEVKEPGTLVKTLEKVSQSVPSERATRLLEKARSKTK